MTKVKCKAQVIVALYMKPMPDEAQINKFSYERGLYLKTLERYFSLKIGPLL